MQAGASELPRSFQSYATYLPLGQTSLKKSAYQPEPPVAARPPTSEVQRSDPSSIGTQSRNASDGRNGSPGMSGGAIAVTVVTSVLLAALIVVSILVIVWVFDKKNKPVASGSGRVSIVVAANVPSATPLNVGVPEHKHEHINGMPDGSSVDHMYNQILQKQQEEQEWENWKRHQQQQQSVEQPSQVQPSNAQPQQYPLVQAAPPPTIPSTHYPSEITGVKPGTRVKAFLPMNAEDDGGRSMRTVSQNLSQKSFKDDSGDWQTLHKLQPGPPGTTVYIHPPNVPQQQR